MFNVCNSNINCSFRPGSIHQIGLKKLNSYPKIFSTDTKNDFNNFKESNESWLNTSACLKRFYSDEKKPFVVLAQSINSQFESVEGYLIEQYGKTVLNLTSKFQKAYSNGLVFKLIESNETFIYKRKLNPSKLNKCYQPPGKPKQCNNECNYCNIKYLFIHNNESSDCVKNFSAYFEKSSVFDGIKVINKFHNKPILDDSIEPISRLCVNFGTDNLVIKLLDEFNVVKYPSLKKFYYLFRIFRIVKFECNDSHFDYFKFHSVSLELVGEKKMPYLMSSIIFDYIGSLEMRHYLLEVEYYDSNDQIIWDKKMLVYFNSNHSGRCSRQSFVFDSIVNFATLNVSFTPSIYYSYVNLKFNIRDLKLPIGYFECKNGYSYLLPFIPIIFTILTLTISMVIITLIYLLRKKSSYSHERVLFYLSTRSDKNFELIVNKFSKLLSVKFYFSFKINIV